MPGGPSTNDTSPAVTAHDAQRHKSHAMGKLEGRFLSCHTGRLQPFTMMALLLAITPWSAFSATADPDAASRGHAEWARCEREEFVEVIHRAWHECGTERSVRTPECREFREHLAGMDRPTPEQRRALAIGYATLSTLETDAEKRDDLKQSSLDIMRALVRDEPEDPRWTYTLGLMEEEAERSIPLLERTLDLDPACVTAAETLADTLRMSEYALMRIGGEDGDDSRPNLAKAREYMMYAYQHANGRQKLEYARGYMEYIESSHRKPLQAYEAERSIRDDQDAFRARIIHDMALGDLPFDQANRADSLDLICNGLALEIGIEGFCFQAMTMLAERDRQAGRPLGEDVLRAIELLATRILNNPPFPHSGLQVHRVFGTDARYLMYMRDLLDAEPENRRTPLYYEAYAMMTSMQHRVGVFRRALELDPGNGRVALNLAESYRELGLYDEAEKAYRHVIDHDDQRIRHDSGISYSTMAEKELRKLRSTPTDRGE